MKDSSEELSSAPCSRRVIIGGRVWPRNIGVLRNGLGDLMGGLDSLRSNISTSEVVGAIED